jgi:hypothetical protein
VGTQPHSLICTMIRLHILGPFVPMLILREKAWETKAVSRTISSKESRLVAHWSSSGLKWSSAEIHRPTLWPEDAKLPPSLPFPNLAVTVLGTPALSFPHVGSDLWPSLWGWMLPWWIVVPRVGLHFNGPRRGSCAVCIAQPSVDSASAPSFQLGRLLMVIGWERREISIGRQ